MEKQDLKKLSLSAIALKVLNDKENDELRKLSEMEIIKRFRNTGIHYADFIQRENEVAKKRGYNEDGYLFSDNVTMQQLMKVYFEHLCGYSTMHNYFNVIDSPNTLEDFSDMLTEADNRTKFEDAEIMFSEIHLCNNEYKMQPFFQKVVAQEIKNIDKRDGSILLNSIKNELILRLYDEKLRVFDDNDATDIMLFDLFQTGEPGVDYEEFDLFGEYFMMKHNTNSEDFYEKVFQTASPIMKVKLSAMSAINEYAQCADLFPYFVMHTIAMKDASKLRLQRTRLMQQAKAGFEVDYTKIDVPKQLILKK